METYHRLVRYCFIFCLLLLIGTWLSYQELSLPIALTLTLAVMGMGLFFINWSFSHCFSTFSSDAQMQAQFLDDLSPSTKARLLILATALSLFLELSIIRWHSTVFPILALFKNISLLSCFCGLGIGYAVSRWKHIPTLYSVGLLLLQVIFFTFLSTLSAQGSHLEQQVMTGLYYNPVKEQLAMGINIAQNVGNASVFYLFLTSAVLPTILLFIPIGQICGRLMEGLPKLKAYGLNLLGSCAGILGMLIMGYFWLSPTLWFFISLAALVALIPFNKKYILSMVSASLLIVLCLEWPVHPEVKTVHSPYQSLQVGPAVDHKSLISISAAGYYHQRIFDLSFKNANRDRDAFLKATASYYELPYKAAARENSRILVVGSGTGNDVAAALRYNPAHVDAVEIDPAILHLGKLYHPESPYHDPRVHIHLTDARTFFSSAKLASYDLIVFGLLDSHTLLSHASSVRLDSFVYTREAMAQCRSLLKPDGMISLSFAVMNAHLGKKLYQTLYEAFDHSPPVVLQTSYDGNCMVYLQNKEGTLSLSEEFISETGFKDRRAMLTHPDIPDIDISTDDWPFLYMPQKMIPNSYLYSLAFLLVIFSVCIFSLQGLRVNKTHIPFFFLGVGFMLMQTKAITELGLQFGNTWIIVGIVILTILLMAFVANYLVDIYRPRNYTPFFICLLVCLGIGLAAFSYSHATGGWVYKVAMTLLVISPMFFSGMVFSTLLQKFEDISGIMALNIAGAMVGGLLEYNSMAFGFSSLYIFAAVIYVIAWISVKAILR